MRCGTNVLFSIRNINDDTWSRARGSAGDNYLFHPEEFGDTSSLRSKLTAYERRHGEQYTGLELPFGCAIRFRMLPPTQQQKHKFDVPNKEGVLLGWDIQTGGVWHGII